MEGESWLVLGLSGVSCGGKSLTSKKLLSLLPNSIHFCQDTYFYPEDSPNHVKTTKNGAPVTDWEVITALDMEKMRADVKETLQRKPQGDGKHVVILDGFILFQDKVLSSLCDLKVYIDVPYEVSKERRSNRVYEPPDGPGYFDNIVWPASQEYKNNFISNDPEMVILDGRDPVESNARTVINLLAKIYNTRKPA